MKRPRKSKVTSSAISTVRTLPRCEGWRRYGGAFSFGPSHWMQCKELAIVILSGVQIVNGEEEKFSGMPACKKCWIEAIELGSIIVDVSPLNVVNS